MLKIHHLIFLFIGIIGLLAFHKRHNVDASKILSYSVHPKNIQFFSNDADGNKYGSFTKLKQFLNSNNQILNFATNGGMYKKDLTPQGLYIENGEVQIGLDTLREGFGNFYLQPNGIFYITEKNEAYICSTEEFSLEEHIKFATQSGPMLLINGNIHSKLNRGSNNLHIRNGVGVLPNGKLLFAMSKEKINFYDFAMYFKNKGCENALYLDGFVSRTYLPAKNWTQESGRFGVIIAEVN